MITQQILKIANDTKNYGIKKKSKYIATSKNSYCGDKITVELIFLKEKVLKMYYETESCIFCQASASLLSKSIKNLRIKDFSNNLDDIISNKKLKSFKKLFTRKYQNRIECIKLPFNAAMKIIHKYK